MEETYPIVDISDWLVVRDETLGTKRKFWILGPNLKFYLFKFRKSPEVGDDWSEKIAAEIAERLHIAHAEVNLAKYNEDLGMITTNFLIHDEVKNQWSLLHGNELLQILDPDYPVKKRYHVAEHTIEQIIKVLKFIDECIYDDSTTPPHAINNSAELFLGYLMLDALIGNTDRHHENWGLVMKDNKVFCLAPSFDHASSLGRELTDETRKKRLTTNDSGYCVEAYAGRARSAIYQNRNDTQTLSPMDAFNSFGKHFPTAQQVWKKELATLGLDALIECVKRVPASRMSNIAKEFAIRILRCNMENILMTGGI